jgi:mannosyltransferase OCH1-like enzyme
MIPKIVHQTWRSDSLPSVFQKISDANKKMNPGYEFKLWSHKPGPPDIDEFIKKEYPDIYDIFNDCKYGVQKADIARIAILYHYGGVYIDLDILSLKPLEELVDFTTDNVYVALEPAEQTKRIFGSDKVLCNAFIVTPPKHPLFKQAMLEIKELVKHHKTAVYDVFNAFGADLISKAMQTNNSILESVKFINRKLVFPINDPKFSDLSSSREEADMIKSGDYKGAYMVHYWIHSDFESKELLEKFRYNDDETIHKNVLRFFGELYPSNANLKS